MKAPLISLLLVTIGIFQTLGQTEELKSLAVSPLPTFGDLTKAGLHLKVLSNVFPPNPATSATNPVSEILLANQDTTFALKSGTSISPSSPNAPESE